MKSEYNHSAIEKKWQSIWAKSKAFKTEEPGSKKKKYYILDMFPYPSGEGLHVGHPKGYIATDIISRMKRMQGFNVLHPMGFDAFGLPAENYAIQTKTNPAVAVAKNVARYKKQLEIIGLDYDWSREVNTTDPKFYKWTQWIFLKLLEHGLAYESNEPVNWCPVDKTILANEDVENGKCERCGATVEKRPIRQWVLAITKYADRMLEDLSLLDWPESIKESQRNWIGRSEGAEIDFEVSKNPQSIKIFTTRPDTIFGATYVVLAPEHKIIKELWDQIENKKEIQNYLESVKNKPEIERTAEGKEKTGVEAKGIFAINPANKEKIPIWIADYVLATYGTGAIMAVPAHDERDGEFAEKYNLQVKQVIEPLFIQDYEPGAYRKEEPILRRPGVITFVKHWKDDKYVALKWKKVAWTTLLTGTIEKENPKETAIREIKEETGYLNLEYVNELGKVHGLFYHVPKKTNKLVDAHILVFKLKDPKKEEISNEENDTHEITWQTTSELRKSLSAQTHQYALDLLLKEGKTFTGNGVLINSGKFSSLDSDKVKRDITKSVKGKWVTKYKLRDWVFSRQRYWGEPIPVLFDDELGVKNAKIEVLKHKVIPVPERDLPVKLPQVKSYEPTGTAESPLASIPGWINYKVGKKMLRRESNTMPQWAGSSWYYLRYMDPNNNKALVDKKKEKYWNTVDLYVGGAEHATRHLIYARFWHKFLYDIGVVSTKEPFQRLQNVGLIHASDGRKMSKRFGNVINPDDIVKTYGADSLRLYEMFIGPFGQAAMWGDENILGVRRFLERVWRISDRILQANSKKSSEKFDSLLHRTIEKVTSDIETMSFNTAVSSMMILLNEMEKTEKVSVKDFEMFLKLLCPFAPHSTSELWQRVGNKSLLVNESWPQADKSKLKSQEVTIAVQVNSRVRAELKVKIDETEEVVASLAKALPDIEKWLQNKEIKKTIFVKNRLVNFVL